MQVPAGRTVAGLPEGNGDAYPVSQVQYFRQKINFCLVFVKGFYTKLNLKMKNSFTHKIATDLKESRINWKVALAFVPIAFFTYLFHELGHWTFGELTGNAMTIGLNNSAPRNGVFTSDRAALWSAIGGPAFTILQASLFLVLTSFTRSVYAFSVAFFAVFSRTFSIVFGGIDLQDEARIASLLDVSKYLVAGLVLAILLLILWKCSRLMKLNGKALGYFVVLGVLAILLVIWTNSMLY
jgi:hypothetical protein